MIIFRPHRGSLAESMDEAKEFCNENEMKEYIITQLITSFGLKDKLTVEDIEIDKNSAVKDIRIGWEDSMNVCVISGMPFCTPCIGMCATKY